MSETLARTFWATSDAVGRGRAVARDAWDLRRPRTLSPSRQETREIGLRLALGATPWSVLWIVLRQALVLTSIGIAVGLAGATALTRLMSGLLYEVQPHDATAFVSASVGLAVKVLSASLIPARRATRVDPIVALRTE